MSSARTGSDKGKSIASREKQILAGLYFSKYDLAGRKKLDFDGFVEALNVIGYVWDRSPVQ
jgi:hypothetical protein